MAIRSGARIQTLFGAAGLLVSGFAWSPVAALRSAEPAPEKAPAEKAAPRPLNRKGTVLWDKEKRRVLLKAEVSLREGTLEQFCCLKQTKEHESILSLDAEAKEVHTALLATGAVPGTPVQFNPDYKPPTGQRIEIFVNWADEKGKQHREPAHTWVRNATQRFWTFQLDALPAGLKLPRDSELRYDNKLKELSWYGPMTNRQKEEFVALSTNREYRKAILFFFEQGQSREMKADWVFAGSAFVKDPDTNQEYYLAESGDLICVANFPAATIDVAIQSSAEGDGLMFEAYTERIPPKGTPVTIELAPVFAKGPAGKSAAVKTTDEKDAKPRSP